jgi:hypothetical protein
MTGGTTLAVYYPSGFSFGGSESTAQAGLVRYRDASTGQVFYGSANVGSGGLQLQTFDTTLSVVVANSCSSTAPFTWTTDDEIRVNITYGIG